MPELIAAGVNALKIEGRMKSPQYVASATRQYRLAIDEGLAGRRVSPLPQQLLELESPFSRGLSQGWLAGRNLQIVDGRHSANRGICVGKIIAVRGDRLAVELTAPLRRGDGIAFPSIRGEDHDQGGRVYEIFDGKQSVKEVAGGRVELAFGAMPSKSAACSPARSFGRPMIRRSTAVCGRRLPPAVPSGGCRWTWRWKPPWAAS